MGLFQKLFGTHSDRELKKVNPIADKVMALEEEFDLEIPDICSEGEPGFDAEHMIYELKKVYEYAIEIIAQSNKTK